MSSHNLYSWVVWSICSWEMPGTRTPACVKPTSGQAELIFLQCCQEVVVWLSCSAGLWLQNSIGFPSGPFSSKAVGAWVNASVSETTACPSFQSFFIFYHMLFFFLFESTSGAVTLSYMYSFPLWVIVTIFVCIPVVCFVPLHSSSHQLIPISLFSFLTIFA